MEKQRLELSQLLTINHISQNISDIFKVLKEEIILT